MSGLFVVCRAGKAGFSGEDRYTMIVCRLALALRPLEDVSRQQVMQSKTIMPK